MENSSSQDSSRCSNSSNSSRTATVFDPIAAGFEELRPWGAGQKFRSAAYADVRRRAHVACDDSPDICGHTLVNVYRLATLTRPLTHSAARNRADRTRAATRDRRLTLAKTIIHQYLNALISHACDY